MFRELAVIGCLGWLAVVGCQATDALESGTTSDATKEAASSASTSDARWASGELKAAGETKITRVSVEIIGTAALVEQSDANAPLAVILPGIAMPGAVHVPFVAWREASEDGKPTGTIETIKDVGGKTGEWRVYRLDREQLVFGNNRSGNPALALPAENAPCAPNLLGGKSEADVACIPKVQSYLAQPLPYMDDLIRPVKPAASIVGRMEIGPGRLFGTVGDKCEWEVTKEAMTAPVNQHFATKTTYRFDLPASESLTLQLRHLDKPVTEVTPLVKLKPNSLGGIEVRFGNAVDVFPTLTHTIKTGDPDPHFHVYYNFLDGPTAMPIPKRTSICHGGPFNELVYCGQTLIIKKKP